VITAAYRNTCWRNAIKLRARSVNSCSFRQLQHLPARRRQTSPQRPAGGGILVTGAGLEMSNGRSPANLLAQELGFFLPLLPQDVDGLWRAGSIP
jgi:hypothetical protein